MANSAAKGRVLVIDDDIDFLESTEAVLSKAGYEVTTARSGEEGMAQATGVHPDVVILDLMLEHPDAGFSVAHKLRQTAGLAQVPILMVTSAARDRGFRFDLDDADARRWIKVDKLLNKPIAAADLLANVAEVTGNAAH